MLINMQMNMAPAENDRVQEKQVSKIEMVIRSLNLDADERRTVQEQSVLHVIVGIHAHVAGCTRSLPGNVLQR